eukprot:1600335-Rhodomonas_salina.1
MSERRRESGRTAKGIEREAAPEASTKRTAKREKSKQDRRGRSFEEGCVRRQGGRGKWSEGGWEARGERKGKRGEHEARARD